MRKVDKHRNTYNWWGRYGWRGAFDFVNRYDFAAQFVKGKKVLEIGFGEGWGTNWLARAGANPIVAGDIKMNFPIYASGRYSRKRKIMFLCMNASQLPFRDAFFDIAVALGVIEHIDSGSTEAFLSEISRVLRPAGKFICSTPVRREGIEPLACARYTLEELNSLIGSHMTIIDRKAMYWKNFDYIEEVEACRGQGRDCPGTFAKSSKNSMNRIINSLLAGERFIWLEQAVFGLVKRLSGSYRVGPLLEESPYLRKQLIIAEKM